MSIFCMAQAQHSQKWIALKRLLLAMTVQQKSIPLVLDEPNTSTSDWGLNTPGEGSIQIDTDPKNANSHETLLELAANREEGGCMSAGLTVRVCRLLTGSAVTLPTTRTWSSFRAILRKGSPVFDADALVNHTVPMKRQTEVTDDLRW